jgi:hypothetical protein
MIVVFGLLVMVIVLDTIDPRESILAEDSALLEAELNQLADATRSFASWSQSSKIVRSNISVTRRFSGATQLVVESMQQNDWILREDKKWNAVASLCKGRFTAAIYAESDLSVSSFSISLSVRRLKSQQCINNI